MLNTIRTSQNTGIRRIAMFQHQQTYLLSRGGGRFWIPYLGKKHHFLGLRFRGYMNWSEVFYSQTTYGGWGVCSWLGKMKQQICSILLTLWFSPQNPQTNKMSLTQQLPLEKMGELSSKSPWEAKNCWKYYRVAQVSMRPSQSSPSAFCDRAPLSEALLICTTARVMRRMKSNKLLVGLLSTWETSKKYPPLKF